MVNNIKNMLDNALVLCYIVSINEGLTPKQRMKHLKNGIFNWQFEDIKEWAKKYGVKIYLERDADDRYESTEKKIVINSRLHPERRYYTLLHECGHLLIDRNWQAFERENPMFATSCDKRGAKSKAYRVSTVAEEIEAWKRGRRLSKKLGHVIDDEIYDTLISDNVMSYIEWAATGGGEF